MADDGKMRRVLLFMPGDDERKVRKGAGLEVDSIIMDLEDGVSWNRKEAARNMIRKALTDETFDFGKTECLVRINPVTTGLHTADLAQTVSGRPAGYVIPKVEAAADVAHVARLLADAETTHHMPPGSIKLLAIIETALGVVNLKDIAQASDRLVALMFGAEDLAGSMGSIRTPEGHEAAFARSSVVLYAAAFGLQAIDTPYIRLDDEAGLLAQTRRAVEMGYTGKMAIHPKQIETIVAAFTPSEEEVRYATRLIAAFEEHQREGTGAFRFEGRMIDQPMVRAAERVLARAESSETRD